MQLCSFYLADICHGAALLARRLQQQDVAALVLLQCSSAAEVAVCHAAALAAAQAVPGDEPHVQVAAPGQLLFSLR